MAVLVTGGMGFVGSSVTCHLANEGEDVVAVHLSPLDRSAQRLLGRFPDRVTAVRADVRDLALLQQIVGDHNVDRVVHAATITPGGAERERELCDAIVAVNLLGTVNVLKMVRSLPSVRRMIYISSTAVYGSILEEGRVTEDDPVAPKGLYAITKYASELMARRWGQLFKLDVVSVRLSSVYGPMERATSSRNRLSAVHAFARLGLEGKPIRVNALSYQTDWIHVWDVGRAIVELLKAPSLSHTTYNVSAGVPHSVGEVLEAFAECLPQMTYSVVAEQESDIWLDPGYQEGPTDNSRLCSDLGFQLQYPLTKGLRQYVRWLSEEDA
jgi:UDP-glucose 4-epimerase